MSKQKLTPAMRRVLERMERGMFIYRETHSRAPYGDLWIDTWAECDPNNPDGYLINGRTVIAMIKREITSNRGEQDSRIYRITPKGRKALEE